MRWVSWYIGWPALAAAGIAAAVLAWRTVRVADDRWAVALPVPGTYTYALPGALLARVQVGSCVRVPFGRRSAIVCM